MKKLLGRVASAPSSANIDASSANQSTHTTLSPRGAAGRPAPPLLHSKSDNSPSNQSSPSSRTQSPFPPGPELPDEELVTELTVGDTLNSQQKRGFAGLCACLLPQINDGSPELQWSKAYLELIIHQFLGLPEAQIEAFMPMLTDRYEALMEYSVSSSSSKKTPPPPSSLMLDKLDPAPFQALLVPKAGGAAHGDEASDDDGSAASKMKKFTGKALGKLKLSKKSDENDAKPGSRPTSPVSSPRASPAEIEAFQADVVKRLLWFTVKSLGYDARVRTLLRVMVGTMHLKWAAITHEEVKIGRALYAEATAMPMEKATSKRSLWDWKRNATIGAAAVAGGALLALTGGMAAPAIATGLTALGGAGVVIGTAVGSAAGVTATTVLFGTAGAGIVGMKTDTRTRGVQQFNFDLVSAGDGMNVYICISGWLDEEDSAMHGFRRSWGDSREYLRGFYRKNNPEKVDQVNQVLDRYRGREDEFFGILRKTYRVTAGSNEVDPLGMTPVSQGAAMGTDTGDDATELMRAWRWKDRFAQGDQYCLAWEEELLRKFGKSMRSFAKDQLIGYANGELVRMTALAALAAAVAIPRTIMKAADMIDNIWVLVMNNADESGKILAETLRRRDQGLRPVTLVGYGMGARLILSCLKKLAKYDDCYGIVENAVLLGAPVEVVSAEWRNARRLVSGRLINGFSENDWMLAVMYRYQGWALNPAGISAIDVAGVENVNLSSIVNGHLDYKHKIGVILDLLRLEG